MTTLYLVRHGETVDNANQIMQGQTQGELNENGIRQALEVSEAWKDRPIDVVIASDLKRSIDTARIIAEPHGLEVVTTPLLRERDWGGFTGRFIPDLKNEVWPDDIETLENLLSRAGEFIAYVKKTFPGKKVLAVGKEGAGCRPRHYQQGRTGSILWQNYERDTAHDECRGTCAGTIILSTASQATMSVRTTTVRTTSTMRERTTAMRTSAM